MAFRFRTRLKWSVVYLLLAGAIALFIGPRALGYVPLWALGAAVGAVAPRIAGHLVGIIVVIPTAAFIATLTTGMIGTGFLARAHHWFGRPSIKPRQEARLMLVNPGQARRTAVRQPKTLGYEVSLTPVGA